MGRGGCAVAGEVEYACLTWMVTSHPVVDDLDTKHGLLLTALFEVAQRRLTDQLGADGPVIAVRI